MRTTGIIGLVAVLSLCAGVSVGAQDVPGADPQDEAIARMPPRLSYIHGQVSFWRPGAQEWVQAQVNTPLAPGDQLYTGSPGTFELQVGPRAFVRASARTQLGLENHEPDFLQFKVTAGRVYFDVRSIEAGHTVEVDTPSAAITLEHPGHYRVEVTGERTALIARRSGRASLIPFGGEAVTVAASEEVVIEGIANPSISGYAAPPLDEWDRWNYARTDALLDAVSARYVTPGTYGVDDLDLYGSWRVVDPYGPIWIPTGVPASWAPYTTGSWVLDPFYGWTWVDTAPWGWAPYHHGRWMYVNGFWGWAPGPIQVRPVYAPALVAFFGGGGVRVGVSIGGPLVGWVALGWGEPCVPWWGRAEFMRRPWWGGWGGPRVVNNVVVHQTTVVHVEQITVYRNAHHQHAVVVVNEDRFGRGRIHGARVAPADLQHLHPTHAAPRVAEAPTQFVPTTRQGIRPPEDDLRRPVVATRPPHRAGDSSGGPERRGGPAAVPTPAPRIVSTPPQREPGSVVSRPPFGQSGIERPAANRPPLPPQQRGEEARRTDRGPVVPQPAPRQAPPQPQAEPKASKPPAAMPPQQARRPETSPARPDRGQPQAPAGREQAGRGDRGAAGPPAAPAQPSAQPGAKTQGGPAPAAPQAPAQRAVAPASPVPPQPPAGAVVRPAPQGRGEATKAQGRPMPGEPASRLAPHRGESRPQQQDKERKASPEHSRKGS